MRLTALRGPLGLALLCLTFAAKVRAGDDPSWAITGYKDRIKTAQTIQPLGETPFGESVDLYKGGLSFHQTDISYPGIGPTISISRSYSVGAEEKHPVGFGDWSLNIPRIETIVPGDLYVNGEWKTKIGDYLRCSHFNVSALPYEPPLHMHWWNGFKMITPDGASQPLLLRDATKNTIAPPASMGTYNIVTARNWMIGCTPLSNPGSGGYQGEGFVALAPDGTRYYFDHLSYGAPLVTLLDESQRPFIVVPRKMGYLFLSKVVDRFNNAINYTYSGDMLVSIDGVGADDRHVAVTWTAGAISKITIQPLSSAAQVWNYTYDASGPLSSVELPDHSKWQFSMGFANAMETLSDPQGCGGSGSVPNSAPPTIFMTHPSGLKGTFAVGWHEFGRSKVPNVCAGGTQGSPDFDSIPPYYLTAALESKSFEGPGLEPEDWIYTYARIASSDPNCRLTGCTAAMSVNVLAPDGYTTRYTHSAEWGPYEGKLLTIVYGISPGSPAGLRTETHAYASTSQGAFPSHLGNDPGLDYSVNDGPIEYLAPESKVTTTQQGVSFERTMGQFDAFSNARSITRSSTGGAGGNLSKTETVAYAPTDSIWLPGRETIRSVGSVEVSKTEYNAVSGLPSASYSFGLLQHSFTYDSTGMLSTVTDGRGKTTTLSQWYRGIPRLISFPTNAFVSAVVDDVGRIQSTTDELQNVSGYGYDAMGRLAAIVYPSGDAVAWNPLSRSMALVTVDDGSGIAGDHWTQTATTGNGRTTTYYDARWLPVLQRTEIIGNAASRSYVVQCFDGLGRQVFKSYPLASATVNCTLPGVRTTYDGIGRAVQMVQDSELGPLVTATEYLNGFQTRVTNPNGFATTTSYQVFDAPSTEAPVRIDAPLGVRTDIARDLFGAPTAVTRSGPGN